MKKYKNHILAIQLFCLSLLIFSCAPATKPKRYADGLPRSTPEKQGVISAGILRFLEASEEEGLELNGFIFIRHGKVIADGWWYPYRPTQNHILHSLSKTFTSTAIGFAVAEGRLRVDDPVISFFPDDLPETISPSLKQLKIKHLLTMSAGHDQAPVFHITDPNWVKSFLATPIDHEPGSRFVYSSYATYMLSAIIQKVTGETLFGYLTPRLFEPLDITGLQWETDAQGINCGGWGLRAKTGDIAKLGLFYLQKGQWDGVQLLPASWIEEASTPHIYQKPHLTPEAIENDDWAQGYGYQIWVCTHDAFRGDGANGQLMVVFPEQDAVIAVNARLGDMQAELNLIWEHLLPAMKEKPLISDEVTNDLLTSKISSLKIPDPFRSPEEIEIPKTSVRKYQVEENSLQVKEISFRFEEDGACTLTLVKGSSTHTFAFGEDAWKYGETDKPGPYFLSPRRNPTGLAPFAVAGFGSWTDADVLQLRLLYLSESLSENYHCTFAGDKLTFLWTNDTGEPTTLTGQLIQ